MAAIKARDPAAWRRLTTLYGPLVYSWARRAGLRGDDAADIMQEVFRAVAASAGRLEYGGPGTTFRGWLWTVARNKVRDFRRRQAGQPPAAGGSEAHDWFLAVPADESAITSGAAPGLGGLLRRAVDLVRGEFEDRTWQAFWRVTVDGRAPADVAGELGMSPNAVYVARSRVLSRLRAVLGDGGDPQASAKRPSSQQE